MLSTFHDDAVVVVVDKLEGSGRRVAHYQTGAHIHRAWCTADGPSPQKGRRCSPSSVSLGRVARDARVPYLRFCAICIVNV